MKDFTLFIYRHLLEALQKQDYLFHTIEEYFTLHHTVSSSPTHSLVLLRHDVDRRPQNALRMAKLEHDLGIKATYYFRSVPQTYKPEIIGRIADSGHEIGYHYENLSSAENKILRMPTKVNLKLKKNSEEYKKKLYELAIIDFKENLAKFRELYPVRNICMHGSPLSKWDSRDLWKKYDYRDFGITSEPYFDIDYNQVLYLTDAGRSWDNSRINLRDKVDSLFDFRFTHSEEIISALKNNLLSEQIMFNIHPEHWTDSNAEWWKIKVVRLLKNTVKKRFVKNR